MKHGHSVRLPLVGYEPYINRKSWMLCTSPMKCGGPVCRMCGNYIDVYGKLPEDWEGDGNAGNLHR